MSLPAGFLDTPFAHRGLHGPDRPENSMAAIRAAVASGYAIELDVQPSGDGVAMVFHDETLDRLTGDTGPVAARSAAALTKIGLHGGGTIPRLDAVLREIDGAVPLVIELKDQSGDLSAVTGDLEAGVAAALGGYAGPVAVMSFNPHMIARMGELAPGVPRGLTTCAFAPGSWDLHPDRREALRAITDYDRVGACFISHEAADLASHQVAALKGRGAGVLCWTIRTQRQAAQAMAYADQITFEGFRPA